MASSRSRLASNITEDYLTCIVCCEMYTDPRKLQCDHTFCYRCIADYSKKYVASAAVPCPVCRQETKQEGCDFDQWISDLPKDSLLVAILKTVNEYQSLSLSCVDENIREPENKKVLCSQHQQQEMDVYCFTHAQELCSECAWIYHKECECSSLEESGERVEEQLTKMKERLDRLHINVNDLRKQGEKTVNHFSENKKNSLTSLHNVQETLQEFWGKAQVSFQHLAQSVHERERNVNETLSSSKIIQKDLESLTNELGNAGQTKNKAERLKFLHKADAKASEYEKTLLGLTYQIKHLPFFTFEENAELVKFCKEFQTIGNLTAPADESSGLTNSIRVSSDTADEQVVAESCNSEQGEQFTFVSGESFFENISHRVIHVGENTRGIYTISGVCIVRDFVVVVDQHNSLLLKYDQQQGICREMLKISEPHQPSVVPQTTKLLVTSWSKQEIYTVETCPKLALQLPAIKTACHYIGIQVLDKNRILVTSLNKTIDIISFSGNVLHKIRPKWGIFSSNPILLPANAVRLSDDTIVVYDSVKKSLAAMDLSGKIRWWKNLNGLSGFTCANDTIYACLRKANVVMTLTSDGKIKDQRFLSKHVGIKRPWAIDIKDNILAVTEDSPSGRFHVVNMMLDREQTSVKEVD